MLFQTASTIKEAVAREYPVLASKHLHTFKNHLMNYVISHTTYLNTQFYYYVFLIRLSLEPFVRQQLLQALAVMIKCAWLDNTPQDRLVIIDSIAQLLQMGGYPVCHIFIFQSSSSSSLW